VDDSQSAALDIAALEAKFQAALGQPMAIPLYAPGVMDFRRGQLLEFEREPIVQLAYLPREGTPMALCLKRAAGKDEAPQFERVHDIGMVRWRQRGIDYVLVGNQSEAELLDYSHNSVRQIAEALVRRGDR
jgi:anti-sigma factor RsiW